MLSDSLGEAISDIDWWIDWHPELYGTPEIRERHQKAREALLELMECIEDSVEEPEIEIVPGRNEFRIGYDDVLKTAVPN